ncbi:BnaC08g44060D [Brassica napus]|uniref:NEDD8-activating enzyme E1 regulatory subunit n=1 Tax=Brassica napus TaxID=3708 RepID=A0A078F6G6_BRANA|nr:BnaC08g44060D [Brassica napus]
MPPMKRKKEEVTMSEPKTKYDRQLRIWGELGQAALEEASICLLNCGPTGSEALKNLVLGGVGSFTVVDGSKVELGDLGNNFMGTRFQLYIPLFEFPVALMILLKATFIEENPDTLISTNPFFFSQFTLVIATQLVEDSMVKLDRICREANDKLVFARSYGLSGFVRVSVKEHTVIDSKPDHFLDDLRLNNPWPELKSFVVTVDLNVSDPVAHKHIPYVVILVKITDEWAQSHSGNLPSTREEKKQDLVKSNMISMDEDNYKEAIEAAFKVFAPRGISSDIQQICNDTCAESSSNSSDFWVMVAALKEFVSNESDGEAPLEGSIPDMTSSTEKSVRDLSSISKPTIKSFCKNARKLKVCRYRMDYSGAMGFYVLLRAVDRFTANYNKFPGQFDGGMDEDISRLKTTALSLLADLGCNGSVLPDDLINEMCRFGASELHVVAAFIGGIASQEVIKLVTKQFVPMLGTYIFNGIDHKSQLLTL